MKNKKLIVGIANLLKISENVVIEALGNEDGDNGLVTTFLDGNNVFTANELATLKTNSKADGVLALESADKFPSAIYNRVKGLAFEKVEKEIAEKYNVEKWDGLNGLVESVVKSSAQGKGGDEEKDRQIETLKKSLVDAEESKTKAIADIIKESNDDLIGRDFKAASALDFEGGDEATIKNQRVLLDGAFRQTHSFEYKGGKTIVLDSNGETLIDKVGESRSLSDVYSEFAVNHGAKLKVIDTGGRGEGSSGTTGSSIFKGKSFDEVLEAKGVKPMTDEADNIFTEWQAANS